MEAEVIEPGHLVKASDIKKRFDDPHYDQNFLSLAQRIKETANLIRIYEPAFGSSLGIFEVTFYHGILGFLGNCTTPQVVYDPQIGWKFAQEYRHRWISKKRLEAIVASTQQKMQEHFPHTEDRPFRTFEGDFYNASSAILVYKNHIIPGTVLDSNTSLRVDRYGDVYESTIMDATLKANTKHSKREDGDSLLVNLSYGRILQGEQKDMQRFHAFLHELDAELGNPIKYVRLLVMNQIALGMQQYYEKLQKALGDKPKYTPIPRNPATGMLTQ